jgi:hypothetical protein
VARRELDKLQPKHEVLQQLWQEGLTRMHLLYLGPSCLDHPFFEELSAVEINTWIYKVLDLGAYPNPRAGPSPLPKGMLAPGLVCLDLFQ